MAAVIQSLQLNFECAADVSSTSTASRKEPSWRNQVDRRPKLCSRNVTVFDLQRSAARYLSLNVRRPDKVQTGIFKSSAGDFQRAQPEVVLHSHAE